MARFFSNLHVGGALRDMGQRWGRARVLSAEGGERGGLRFASLRNTLCI